MALGAKWGKGVQEWQKNRKTPNPFVILGQTDSQPLLIYMPILSHACFPNPKNGRDVLKNHTKANRSLDFFRVSNVVSLGAMFENKPCKSPRSGQRRQNVPQQKKSKKRLCESSIACL